MSATTIVNVAPKHAPAPNDGAVQPVTTLRDWLDHLAARGRLAVMNPNVALRFEVAAISKRHVGVVNSLSGSITAVHTNVEAAYRSILLHYLDPKPIQ
jgi:hypothetical protein